MKVEKICCNEAFAPLPETRVCHIPWAQLEHLKTPGNDHDGRGPPKVDPTQKKHSKGTQKVARTSPEDLKILEKVKSGNVQAAMVPNGTKVYCFRGLDSMAPHCVGQLYWQPWDTQANVTGKATKGGQFDDLFACHMENGDDMVCDRTNENKPKTFPGIYGHIAYHLFFSTKRRSANSKKDILEHGWLLSEMYRRSQL